MSHYMPRGAATLAALYFLSSATTFFWAYMPRQMTGLGWTGAQIGMFFMLMTVGQALATPIWGRLADRRGGDSHSLLRAQYLIAAAAIVMLPWATSWTFGVLIAVVVGATLRTSLPLVDAMALREAGTGKFGRIRSFGTLGFGTVAIAFGLLGAFMDYGTMAKGAPWMMLILLLAALPVVSRLPVARGGSSREVRPRRRESPAAPKMLDLLRRPVVVFVFPVAALFVATHVPYELFLVGLSEERGFGAWLPGLALFIGIMGELFGFLSFRKFIRKMGAERVLLLVVGITGVRWLITGSTTSAIIFAGLQILHGLTFAAFFLALLELLTRHLGRAPGASAQGLLYLLVFATGSGLGTVISGFLYDLGSAATLFQQAGAASLVLLPALAVGLNLAERRAPAPSRELAMAE